MRIVAFRLVLTGAFDVLHGMDQVAVGNHRMMSRLLKLSGAVVFRCAALVLRGMLQKFRRFQMMINALLRHVFRITNAM
ncbi:MAG TPA: hypothetical protein VNU44_09020 [Bryobacteraceae bacterium]|nr:hypothetical protein [Bryobacteraceae bacterium]